ncbi:MAG: TlyA family RNA methyltransferase [Syntrophomonadaceae bacterium]|nr:TlyA family RNA methyltransferase [Syntrophomonadaceae bacterium]
MAKVRLDALLYSQGLAPSREKARAYILAGQVQVNGQRVDKPGTSVDEEAQVEIISTGRRFVSRGGFKLEKALQEFQVDVRDKVIIDIGASTGGYTDCVLQSGARKVYAVDVGYGQLDWTLRNDPRVVNLERTNIRYIEPELISELADLITIDVSFISLELVFPVSRGLLKEAGIVICLVKPQFEAGRDRVGKKGVVRDPQIHRQVLMSCVNSASAVGLNCTGITYSPIKGPQGNIEYFLKLTATESPLDNIGDIIDQVVDSAHLQLGGKGSEKSTAD